MFELCAQRAAGVEVAEMFYIEAVSFEQGDGERVADDELYGCGGCGGKADGSGFFDVGERDGDVGFFCEGALRVGGQGDEEDREAS